MAEKSIPRAPRIEMVVVSPEIVETTNKYFITSSQKTLDAMAKVALLCG